MKVLDNAQWVEQQFAGCQLGHRLRTKRLLKVAAHMLNSPEASLPQQNPHWADLKAAYRLFSQEEVTCDAVAEPHWQQTRATRPGRYLLISDTTDIDHFSHRATTGLGQLGKGNGRGMQLHSCLVYHDDERQIVGTAGALIHYRMKVPKGEKRNERLARSRESELWGSLVAKVGAPPPGSQWIHIFDRGGDNFEALCNISIQRCDYVIRAAKLDRKVINDQGDVVPLKQALERGRVLGRYELFLRSRPGVKARTATLEVSVTTVTFPRPRHHSQWVKECGLRELQVNVVIVRETQALRGTTPICWVLLTSLPTQTFEQALQVIKDYENRWLIEEYHKVIKTGCSVELHALRTADRLEPLIGLISVIGTRLFQMKLLGRNQPATKAATHIPSCWLKCLTLARPRLKVTSLTVYDFFRELAKLGGFLGRKGDGEPGWQTIWCGYRRLHNLLEGMRLAGAV